ncbi:MAG: hypothetical protein JXA49_09375 [Actinobacteria bacterium]|nr:hypothetical protein [Actinomycetota bacterium]
MDKTCPGQSQMFWKPEDIYEVKCPECGNMIEFFKDDVARKCRSCGTKLKNPKLDMGCVEWCRYAEECMAEFGELPRKEDEEDVKTAG